MLLSLMFPSVPSSPQEAVEFASRVGDGRTYARLWQGQAHRLDPVATFAALAGAGHRVPVGMGVAIMPLRNPYQAALEARTLAVLSGSSPVYGIGPGSALRQRMLLGAPYASPLRAVREYVGAVRHALGDTSEVPAGRERQYFAVPGPLPPVASPPVRIGLGVLRPRMAHLAGEVADAAVTWLVPPAHLRDTVVPALAAGAEAARRARPHLAALVPVALRRSGRCPEQLVHDIAGGHFALPHYADMLRSAGIAVSPSDPLGSATAFLRAGGFGYGSAEDVVDHLLDHSTAGVDEVVLALGATHLRHGPDEALADLDEITGVLRRRSRAREVTPARSW